MNTQEIIIVVILLVVLYSCRKAPYGGLMTRPMPKVVYINGHANGPYECADSRDGLEFVVTA